MRVLFLYTECSVICFILLGFCYIRARRYTDSTMFFFRNVLIKTMLLNLVDLLAHISYVCVKAGVLPDFLIGIDVFFILAYLMIFIYLSYSIFLKQTVFFFPDRMASVSSFILYSIPFWVSSVLILSSFFNELIVTRNEIGLPEAGRLMWTLFIFFLFYVTCLLIDPLERINSEERKGGPLSNTMAMIVLSAIIPVLCGIYDIANQTSYFVSGLSVGLFFTYLVLQKRNISTDYLTGLNKSSELKNYLARRFSKPEKIDRQCLMFLDINRFKSINDHYGHAEGDRAIKLIAGVLMKVAKAQKCFLCRYGGDEFVLSIPYCTSEMAEKVKNSIEEMVREVDSLSSVPYKLSVSTGYVMYEPKYKSVQDFLDAADRHMYENKRRFHNGKDNQPT